MIELIEQIKRSKFTSLTSPGEVTQIIRGKIFTNIDVFMTNLSSNQFVKEIVEVLYSFIDLMVEFLVFVKEEIKYSDFLSKNSDYYLVDFKCALFACCYELVITMKRIFGGERRLNEFYKLNEQVIKSMQSRASKRYCADSCYKSFSTNSDKISAVIIANFVDYFDVIGECVDCNGRLWVWL